ncbi:UNVERIFIED_CONTAM: hypothetical protein Slati_2051200 [Sesamum latifolium]|uniref:Uncharacterized protein n=1 Tax=Sesamum latifolium TaxID=2727402 RepID=A0AAW2WPE0_9LAMI
MEIPEKLLKFKFHILFGVALSLFIFFLCYLAPSFLDVLKYFWPLLLSTALFSSPSLFSAGFRRRWRKLRGRKPGKGCWITWPANRSKYSPY